MGGFFVLKKRKEVIQVEIDQKRIDWHKRREFNTGPDLEIDVFYDTEGNCIFRAQIGLNDPGCYKNPGLPGRLTYKQIRHLSKTPGQVRTVKGGQYEPVSQVDDESMRPFYEQQKRKLSKNPRNMRDFLLKQRT